MRKYVGFLLLASGMALIPTYSWSQFQFPGGRGKMSMDPDEIFTKYANGKEVIVFSELDARDQQKLTFLSSMVGIKIGERTTREEFKQHFSKVTSMMQGGGLSFPGKGGLGTTSAALTTPPATSVAPPTSEAPRSFGPPRTPADREAMIEAIFRRYDRNNDGNLSADEIPESMQRDRETYDTNHDGFIDLAEFKNFMATVRPPRDPESRPPDGERPMIEPREGEPSSRSLTPEEQKPTVYRVGKLPKDLPEWFIRLDKQGDCDGQVGLWEARNDKAVLEEFSKYDLNGDGLITAEEVLRYKASLAKKTETSDTVATNRDRGSSIRTAPGSGGGSQTFIMPSVAVPPTTSNLTIPPTTVSPPSAETRPFGGVGSGNNGFRGFSGFGKGKGSNSSKN